jgi:hypothetical protein
VKANGVYITEDVLNYAVKMTTRNNFKKQNIVVVLRENLPAQKKLHALFRQSA